MPKPCSAGKGSNGVPPRKGVGAPSSDDVDCVDSLGAVGCAVFCADVVSVGKSLAVAVGDDVS